LMRPMGTSMLKPQVAARCLATSSFHSASCTVQHSTTQCVQGPTAWSNESRGRYKQDTVFRHAVPVLPEIAEPQP
jgi:hypothetical protein